MLQLSLLQMTFLSMGATSQTLQDLATMPQSGDLVAAQSERPQYKARDKVGAQAAVAQ